MDEKTQENVSKGISADSMKKNIESVKEINFDYIKSNQFRVIHTDGAHGGVSPNGRLIQMAIFSERSPIPKKETFKLDAGKIVEKIGTEQRDAVVREVEVELLMSIETAKAICNWMYEKIKHIESIQSEIT